MYRYAFRESAVLRRDADPQVYGEAIRALGDEHGYVSPDDVWRAARKATHPLHPEFEWDKTKAAEAHWRQRSRQLIGAIYIMAEANKPARPAYFNVQAEDGRRYVPEEQVAADIMLRTALLENAVRELRSFRRRFGRMTYIVGFLDAAIQAAEQHLNDADSATREAAE